MGIPCLYPPLKADAWDHCAGSPPYNKSCYEYTTVGDKAAGLGTYYDLDCNTTNPGVGCNAYGHPLCRSCLLNGTDVGHGQCPKLPCLENEFRTQAWDHCGGNQTYKEDC